MIWSELKKQWLFGFVDGINGAVGLVIGLLGSDAAHNLVFVALLSRAGSSAVSMAGAEYESDDGKMTKRTRVDRVAAMGVGYLASALLPGVGFAISNHVGVAVFVPATIAVLAAITWSRSESAGWARATATTLVIFVLAVAAGLLAGLVG